jgi:uncharacterized protein YbaP (TraB family)
MARKRKSTTTAFALVVIIVATLAFLVLLEKNPDLFQNKVAKTTKDKPVPAAPAPSPSQPVPAPSQPTSKPPTQPQPLAQLPKTLPVPAEPAKSIDLIRPTKFKQGLFWKIERPGFKPSYLLGTVHVGRAELNELKARVIPVIKQASSFCTEIKLDRATTLEVQRAMFYNDGRSLKQVVGEELYRRIVAASQQRGIPLSLVGRMKPWAIGYLLNMPKKVNAILDLQLYQLAARENKVLCGLEQVQEQLSALNSYTPEQQAKILSVTLDNLALIEQQNEQLIQHYINRDLAAMVELSEEGPIVKDRQLENLFLYRLLIRRNVIMVNRMQPYLQKGNAFFAVGAMHLPGSSGMLRLLESQGYTITKLY